MKKILTLALILFLVKANAQISVIPVSCGGHDFHLRATITEIYVPAHDVSTTTCPDNTVHDDTEEGNYIQCRMELFGDAACTLPVSVDPRFFAFARDVPGSTGTANNPSVIYRYACAAPLPAGSEYDNNQRVDRTAVNIQQCIWECVGAGYYNCYPTDFGVPLNYNIVINCCYAPEKLAVQLVSFEGLRNGNANTLRWHLENKQDFARLELERSPDGTNFTTVYTTGNPSIDSYVEQVDNTSYYRLKLYNTNGSSFHSSMVVLRGVFDLKKTFRVSPSPFVNQLHVAVSATGNQKAVFRLVSMDGKNVFEAERLLKAGINAFDFHIPPVSKGVYIMAMTDDNGTAAVKVLKQ